MKKILAFLLATLMISLSFASCESVVKPTSSNDDTETNALDTNEPESDTNAPESETDAPQADEPPSILPVYSGTPDVSWYTGDKTEYTITTAEQLAGINQLRKNSEGSITFEGVTIKLGADIAINGGTMQETTYAMKFIGGFVGKVESGTLTMTNCHFNGTIDFANSTYATAFVGMTNSATLILNNCHGDGYVKCYNYIAGLSGYTDNTTKTNNDSCFTGTLKATKATDTNSNASFIK